MEGLFDRALKAVLVVVSFAIGVAPFVPRVRAETLGGDDHEQICQPNGLMLRYRGPAPFYISPIVDTLQFKEEKKPSGETEKVTPNLRYERVVDGEDGTEMGVRGLSERFAKKQLIALAFADQWREKSVVGADGRTVSVPEHALLVTVVPAADVDMEKSTHCNIEDPD